MSKKEIFPHTRFIFPRMALFSAALLALALSLPASAGNFGVTPIRVDLDKNTKTGSVTVQNGDEGELRAQTELFEWTQDATGKDQYRKCEDLLYFPKLMAFKVNEEKVVRVALKSPAVNQEKTYRLFIQELPAPPPKDSAPGAKVGIAIRFGVPVFIKPAQEKIDGKIEQMSVSKGVLHLQVRNTGNVHFAIEKITASAASGFTKSVEGWYLLPGVARDYSVPLEHCNQLKDIEIKVKTDVSEFSGTYTVNPAQCN